jgi:hydrogenase maturation protein HypF
MSAGITAHPFTAQRITAQRITAQRITVTGIVQGVGFRPFVYTLAQSHGLGGWVFNTTFGVEIVVVGPDDALTAFRADLEHRAPPLALLDQISDAAIPLPAAADYADDNGAPRFTIRHSQAQAGDFVPVSPDVALCDDCRRELLDPADRRYRYPFINCTHCGPRYTIIRSMPYDRPATTMAEFALCPACRAEYDDPGNRRFHAQPIACPVCGPQITLVASSAQPQHAPYGHAPSYGHEPSCPDPLAGDAALLACQRILAAGGIVAIKGLGGFHLACDAANPAAVATLRARKQRGAKPFAVMARDLETAATIAVLDATAARLLQDRSHPILLLDQRTPSPLADGVAPDAPSVGVMLPYTPLHLLLLTPHPAAPELAPPPLLVMTSGNLSEEPIAFDNDDALVRLAPLADAFLLHNRPIHNHCDDSVARPAQHHALPIRRARGLAPLPIRLPFAVSPILAVGAELKNTFCLTQDHYALLSPHIGDMENLATLAAFERTLAHYRDLFRISPGGVNHLACDLHPGYFATRWAEAHAAQTGLPLTRVQHHHAHLAALLAEHGLPLDTRAVGLILDGSGYGADGAIWGGELLVGGYAQAQRVGRLRPIPLPGGDAAIRRPARVALAHLWAAGLPWTDTLPPVAATSATERAILARQFTTGFNTVPTSSMGRLFDAVASLIGLRHVVAYEAQAAIALEAHARRGLADAPLGHLSPYPLTLVPVKSPLSSAPDALQWEWDAAPLVQAVVADLQVGESPARMAARFHLGLAAALVEAAQWAATYGQTDLVALSGGVWQNTTLLDLTVDGLAAAGLRPLLHRRLPPNDGGIAVGQALVAHALTTG